MEQMWYAYHQNDKKNKNNQKRQLKQVSLTTTDASIN